MNVLKVNQKQTQQIKQIQNIKLANLVSMKENKFAKMIKEIEEEPLFKKLMYPENHKEKVIGYERFPHTDLSSNFYELKEEIVRDSSLPELELSLLEKKDVIEIAKRIGENRFKKYFLHCEEAISLKQIARECKLNISEVKKLMEIINKISIYNEFYHPSELSISGHYTKI
ncbi:MAG: hypothetical protein AB1633_09480, partial [Elusimicrobiota bacterium]